MLAAPQNFSLARSTIPGWWTTEDGKQESRRGPQPADARILPLAADVVAARARSRDAAIPAIAAQSRADRTAMADPARADRGGHHRSHGIGACRVPAWAEPVANPARSRSARSDRAARCRGR